MDFEIFFTYFRYLYPPVVFIGLLCALDVILKGRTAPGTIAWALSLLFMPLLTIPLYLIFGGRKFHGYVKARRRETTEAKKVGDHLIEQLEKFAPKDLPVTTQVLAKLAMIPVTTGNRLTILKNGKEKFAVLFKEIGKAKKYILVQYYIVRGDETGNKLKDALISKAAEGVKVYFLYDAIGCYELSNSYLKELRRAGIIVEQFGNYRFIKNKFQLNFRNHRKIVIIDGSVALCGGLNVGNEYLGEEVGLPCWRDTHLQVVGPAVDAIQLNFLEDWLSMSEKPIDELCWETDNCGDDLALVLPTGPADELENSTHAFLLACHAAKERLWLTTPYFVPSTVILSALEAASLRGVDVRIILPNKADNIMVQFSSYSYLDDAGKYGINFYRYNKGFLHQKAILVDNYIAAIGTVNLDNRSFNLNFEMMLYGFSSPFIKEVGELFEEDFKNSVVIPRDEFQHKSFFFKLFSRICRLLSPLQ